MIHECGQKSKYPLTFSFRKFSRMHSDIHIFLGLLDVISDNLALTFSPPKPVTVGLYLFDESGAHMHVFTISNIRY